MQRPDAPLKPTPEQLDLARRQWLDGIARQHSLASSADSALSLAQAQWMCGEYDAAMTHFIEARDRAPAKPETHLALVRAASMLGEEALEAEALSLALSRHRGDPGLHLHAALACVPDDLSRARALLAPFRGQPAIDEYDIAIEALHTGREPRPSGHAEPGPDAERQAARRASLAWATRYASSVRAHEGLPTRVLSRALGEAPEAGLTLECGVYFGRSLRLIAARTAGAVHGFDSFAGLPEAWSEHEGAGAYSTAGRQPKVAGNVRLHAGWFEQTLQPFFAAHTGPIRLLHVDCDLYSATRTVLTHANERLVAGSILVFDDLLGYPGYLDHELRAFNEFVAEHGVHWELLAACLMGREVAIRITGR